MSMIKKSVKENNGRGADTNIRNRCLCVGGGRYHLVLIENVDSWWSLNSSRIEESLELLHFLKVFSFQVFFENDFFPVCVF